MKKEVLNYVAAGLVNCFLIAGNALAGDASPGLVAHYPLDGSAVNALGTGNDGLLNGVTAGSDRFGNPASVCYFDGTASISMPAKPSISTTSSITYAFWLVSTYDGLYRSSQDDWDQVWWLDRTAESDPTFSLALTTKPYGQFWFHPRCDDPTWPTNRAALVGGELKPQVWQHIAMVRDYGQSYRLYVDGVRVGAEVYDNGAPLTLPAIQLGKHAWNADMGFIGKMDDLRIYNRALTAEEVQALAGVNQPPHATITISPLAQFPRLTNLIVIAANGMDAEVILDGSQSSDPDNDSLAFSWWAGDQHLGTNVTITAQLAVGTHEITLFVSDGKTNVTETVTVDVLSLADAIGIVMETVEQANLGRRNPQALYASLQAAAASFERDNFRAGINQLTAFQQKVRAQIAPFNPTLAEELNKSAQVIINAAGGKW